MKHMECACFVIYKCEMVFSLRISEFFLRVFMRLGLYLLLARQNDIFSPCHPTGRSSVLLTNICSISFACLKPKSSEAGEIYQTL